MPFLESSGTQTAVISTEHTLVSITTNKTLLLVVDLINMVASDTTELRIKTKVLSGGVLRTVYYQRFVNAQAADDIISVSIPLPSDIQADFTLKQTAGTGRNYPWKVLSI